MDVSRDPLADSLLTPPVLPLLILLLPGWNRVRKAEKIKSSPPDIVQSTKQHSFVTKSDLFSWATTFSASWSNF